LACDERGRGKRPQRVSGLSVGGTWIQDGQTKIVAQRTVVIPGSDSLYVLQLNADCLENQGDFADARATR
jgi:hypothetical protein